MPTCKLYLAAMDVTTSRCLLEPRLYMGRNPRPEFEHQGQDLHSHPRQGRLLLGHLQEDVRSQRDSMHKDVLRDFGCAPSTDLTPQPPWGLRPELVKTVMQSAFYFWQSQLGKANFLCPG